MSDSKYGQGQMNVKGHIRRFLDYEICTADGHKQITPFFFAILLILWLGPITGYKLNSFEGVIKPVNLLFVHSEGCEVELGSVKHLSVASWLRL
jgi:hypothetical protein